MKVIKQCSHCGKDIEMYPSRAKKSKIYFCNKSCHRSYKNNIDNPSWLRDLSGKNNPMYGKHPEAWNKGNIGNDCHSWKGGLHKRKDGYYRININGKRYLFHRYLLNVNDERVIHHIDRDRSNNKRSNLCILANQKEHAKLHKSETSS